MGLKWMPFLSFIFKSFTLGITEDMNEHNILGIFTHIQHLNKEE